MVFLLHVQLKTPALLVGVFQVLRTVASACEKTAVSQVVPGMESQGFSGLFYVPQTFWVHFSWAMASGWNTSSKRSAVRKPSFTQASFREMFSLKASFTVFAAFS